MESGRLRQQITIQAVTESRAADGAVTQTWATFIPAWAAVLPISGHEYMQAAQVQAQLTHRVRMRYYPGITPKMRVLFGTRVLHIEYVRDIEERTREMELLCREEV